MRRDPWEILEVEKTASQSEIKSAYRALARVWHPDSNSSEEAEERWLEISWAWEVVSKGDEIPVFAYPAKLEHTFVSLFTQPERVKVLVPGELPAGSKIEIHVGDQTRSVLLDQVSKPGDVLSAEIDDEQIFIFLKKAQGSGA